MSADIILVTPFNMTNTCTRRLTYFTNNLNKLGFEAETVQYASLKIRDAEVVHILKPHLRSAVPAKLLAKDAKMVLDVDDYDPEILAEQGRIYEAAISRYIWDAMLPRFSTVITATEELKRCISRKDAAVINNGADTSFFKPMQTPVKNQSIAYCGSLNNYKQIEPIIVAFSKIHKEYPKSTLNIIGDGKAKDNIIHLSQKLRIRNSCFFCGHIPFDHIPTFLSTFEVLIDLRFNSLSAKMASPGMKGYEYMAMGKPIISPKCEVFNDEFAYPVGNVEEAKDAFVSIQEEPKKARRKARKARQEAVEKYDWKVLTKKLIKVYEGLP